MPLYEYQCDVCGRFEKIVKFSDPPLGACPTCGGTVRKLFSSPAIQFKGSGFYINDYAKKKSQESSGGQASSEKSAGDSSSGDKSTSDNSSGDKSSGEKPSSDKSEKPSSGSSSSAPAPAAATSTKD